MAHARLRTPSMRRAGFVFIADSSLITPAVVQALPVSVMDCVVVPTFGSITAKEKTVKGKKNRNEQPGDILGISNPGGPKLPHPPSDGSTPQGIEVRGEPGRHWGDEDIPQSDGATGIDMGGAGDSTQIAPEHPRPKVDEKI